MKNLKLGNKSGSNFNLRRRKLNIGASLHVLPSRLELQRAFGVNQGSSSKSKKKFGHKQMNSQINSSKSIEKSKYTKLKQKRKSKDGYTKMTIPNIPKSYSTYFDKSRFGKIQNSSRFPNLSISPNKTRVQGLKNRYTPSSKQGYFRDSLQRNTISPKQVTSTMKSGSACSKLGKSTKNQYNSGISSQKSISKKINSDFLSRISESPSQSSKIIFANSGSMINTETVNNINQINNLNMFKVVISEDRLKNGSSASKKMKYSASTTPKTSFPERKSS
ncbi:unnamed protein product [Moneuplotes crassus]|uniref:Uncharacterized protein n=1 Tax=Euplotes crassus TaxID=5936 RepID=A0AAD1XFB2_EUPCR|nr:unnamed protein product [Moneuplotes crassus]